LEEEEVNGMGKEDLEDHRVVEESIESAPCEEEEVHRAVDDSFESLREDQVCAWLSAKNKGMKATASLQIPANRFNDPIREVWMSVAARRKAAWEAWVAASMSGCTNHSPARWQRSTMQTHQAALAQDPAGAAICSMVQTHLGHMLNGADASSTSGSHGGGLVIDVSFEYEEDV
jgi:hypothetical protein